MDIYLVVFIPSFKRLKRGWVAWCRYNRGYTHLKQGATSAESHFHLEVKYNQYPGSWCSGHSWSEKICSLLPGNRTVAANTCGMLVALHGTCHAAVVWHLVPWKTGYNRVSFQLLCSLMKKNVFFVFMCFNWVTQITWNEVGFSWRLFAGVTVKSPVTSFLCALLPLCRETVVVLELLVTGVCCGCILSRSLLF